MNNDDMLIAEVANMYYNLHYSQDQIAEKLFLSRSKVSRMIQKGIDSGIVEIKINLPNKRCSDLEEKLKNKFHLQDCHVLQTGEHFGFDQICNYAAKYIDSYIRDNIIIGVSSGKTVHNVCSKLDFKLVNNLTFSQVKGSAGIGAEYIYDSPNLILALSNKFSSNFNLIYSPLYVFNEEVRDYLMNELIIVNALKIAKKADLLISSLGVPAYDNSKIYTEYLKTSYMKNIFDKKPVASYIGHFFDKHGNALDSKIEKSIIGLSVEDIKKINKRVVVVYGEEKSEALETILKAGFISILIVDEKCVKKVNM